MRIDSSSRTTSGLYSSSSSMVALASAKLVGGICLLSPTTTTDFARPIAPTASATRICDASSNTTMSKTPGLAGKKRATESGLINVHGRICVIRSPKFSISARTVMPPRLRSS